MADHQLLGFAAICVGIAWLSWKFTVALGPHPYIALFAPEHLRAALDDDAKRDAAG